MPKQHDYSDPDGTLAASVAHAQVGVFTGFDSILRALEHLDDAVRLRAAACCQHIGFYKAVDPLARMAYSDSDSANRAQAVYALGGIGKPAVIPPIVAVLADEEDECREAARTVLFRMLGSLELLALFGDEGDSLDPDERMRVEKWWKDHAKSFDRARVYAMGKLASPAVFIEHLKEATISLPDAYLTQLRDWTGQDFGESPLRKVIERWENWWSKNKERYEPGRRYFYGHRID
jgi:HEAT repeat protein